MEYRNPKLLCRVWIRGVLAICGYHGHGFGEPPDHGISQGGGTDFLANVVIGELSWMTSGNDHPECIASHFVWVAELLALTEIIYPAPNGLRAYFRGLLR